MIMAHSPKMRVAHVLLGGVLAAMLAGCGGGDGGGGSVASVPPPPLENKEEIATHLPTGVTFDTPIVANKMFGENSKTVGDALASLHARVRDKKLVDGGMGQVIGFQKAGEKASKKAKTGSLTIELAQ